MDYSKMIQVVATYIENNVTNPINIEDLERVSGYSIVHFRDLFKRYTGKTLARYILERRIYNAANTLVHTNKSVLAVAIEYQFTSHDSFTRAFRRIIGFSPSIFRRLRIPMGQTELCTGITGIKVFS